jgi:hypothetical protein
MPIDQAPASYFSPIHFDCFSVAVFEWGSRHWPILSPIHKSESSIFHSHLRAENETNQQDMFTFQTKDYPQIVVALSQSCHAV